MAEPTNILSLVLYECNFRKVPQDIILFLENQNFFPFLLNIALSVKLDLGMQYLLHLHSRFNVICVIT